MSRILSLNVWVGVFCILCAAGIVLAVFGMITDQEWARTVGLVLISPIVIMGILLVVAGFPILIIANRRHASQTREDYNDPRDDVQPM